MVGDNGGIVVGESGVQDLTQLFHALLDSVEKFDSICLCHLSK